PAAEHRPARRPRRDPGATARAAAGADADRFAGVAGRLASSRRRRAGGGAAPWLRQLPGAVAYPDHLPRRAAPGRAASALPERGASRQGIAVVKANWRLEPDRLDRVRPSRDDEAVQNLYWARACWYTGPRGF